ncbi:MAG: AI-2E family transporter [Dehalococcoidia bacterium]
MNAQRWRVVLWFALFALIFFVFARASSALIPFALGALGAFTLTPVVDMIAAAIPARPFQLFTRSQHQVTVFRRGFAVLVVYIVLGLALFGVGAVIVPIAVDQSVEFVEALPELVEDAREQSADWLTQYREQVPVNVQERIDGYAADAAGAFAESIAGVARQSVDVLTNTLGIVFGFLVIPIWMFYALRDRHQAGRNFMNAVPETLRPDVANVLAIGDRLLLRYIRGQLMLGVIVGTAVGIGLTLMDVQLSLALGVFAGITELIPIIGPWIGAIPALLIVAGTDPDMILWVGLLYLAVQQVENNMLVPRIQGQAVDLHPGMVIMLLVVAGAAFGFIGLLAVMPLTAIIRELFWYADRRLKGETPQQAYNEAHVVRVATASRPLLARLFAPRRRAAAEPADAVASAEGGSPEGEA